MGLIFDGVDIEETYGILVDGADTWPKPARDRTLIHVPGRNGDIIMDNGCWHNVEITYHLLIKDGWKDLFEEFTTWLCSHIGYFRLEDQDRHPDVYRVAEFPGPMDPELWFTTETGVFDLTFNCKPQQYLITGGQQLNLQAGAVLGYLVQSPLGFETVDASDLSARATPLLQYDQSSTTITITNDSDRAVSFTLAAGWYDSSKTLLRVDSWAETLGPGLSLNITSNAPSGVSWAYRRFSVHFTQGSWADEVSFTMTPAGGASYSLGPQLGTINNPTPYNAFPLLYFDLTNVQQETMAVALNDFNIALEGVTDFFDGVTDLYIDCELEDCYSIDTGETYNQNAAVTITNSNPREFRDFPYLKPGRNTIRLEAIADEAAVTVLSGTQSAVLAVTPRTYTI